jgi:hypothetical protein
MFIVAPGPKTNGVLANSLGLRISQRVGQRTAILIDQRVALQALQAQRKKISWASSDF